MIPSNFSSADLPELIPREVLFGNPEKAGAQISPDGRNVAYLAPFDGVLNVWVKSRDLEDNKPVTKDTDRGVQNYFWSHGSREIFYLQDAAGDENWRLYSVDTESGAAPRDLTPFKNVQVRIVEMDKHFPNEMYVAINKEDPKNHDLYHMNLNTGELKMVVKNPGDQIGWLIDSNFKVRGTLVYKDDGSEELFVRDADDAPWQKVLTWNAEDAPTSGPIIFSKDGKFLYMRDSREFNTSRLVKMELKNRRIEVLAEDPVYDVSSVMIHPDNYEVQIAFFEKARQDWLIFDKSIEQDIEAIRGLHPGDFFIANRDDADQTWIVGFVADKGPVPYYLYERSTRQAHLLFVNRPKLMNYTLASMEPIQFKARDGLTLHGYITFPAGIGRENLPLVLNVHGGPWARDVWGYDPECQWLANRGYICLLVNYRGSTGYGKKFTNAGDKEWGGKMQDDLTDAVRWAVEKGYADGRRLAIYGGSYGGYAALAGAAFTPDLFSCAVSVVGPSNLVTFIQTIPPYWNIYLSRFYSKVGHPEKEAEFLKSRSPLFKVDQIKVPVLIAQGANDPRVKQSESEQIVQAMKEKGIDHEYLLFPDEGHGFVKPENRLKFYAAAEKFLTEHLGGRFEAG